MIDLEPESEQSSISISLSNDVKLKKGKEVNLIDLEQSLGQAEFLLRPRDSYSLDSSEEPFVTGAKLLEVVERMISTKMELFQPSKLDSGPLIPLSQPVIDTENVQKIFDDLMTSRLNLVQRLQDEYTIQVRNQLKSRQEFARQLLELQSKTSELDKSQLVSLQSADGIIEIAKLSILIENST